MEITKQKMLDNDIYICRLIAVMKTPRLSPQTLRVLERFIGGPTAWRYGYEPAAKQASSPARSTPSSCVSPNIPY